jgi:hypothetical protein
MWRVCKEAGRPWPQVAEDSVIDYMIMEAVAIKVRKEDAQAEKDAKRNEFKMDREHLKQYQ